MKRRKVQIVLPLIEESKDLTNEMLLKEIREGLSETIIPWCKELERIQIIEE